MTPLALVRFPWRLWLWALLMTAGVLFYGVGLMDLVAFGFLFAAHFVLGWIYLFLSLLFLPHASGVPTKGNPFQPKREN